MKLLLLSLLAVHCSTVVSNSVQKPRGIDRLKEVLSFVKFAEGSLKNSEHLISTPPRNTEECCLLSDLRCFRSNLQQHFNSTYVKPSHTVHVRKLIRGLKSPITEETMNFCNSNNTTSTCQDTCEMHPKKSAQQFFEGLQSLIQRALSNCQEKDRR